MTPCQKLLKKSFIKNEVGMTPCQKLLKQEGTELRACNNLPQPPKTKDVGRGLWKIVACSQSSSQCLLVSTVFGTVSSLHPTSFVMIFTLVITMNTAVSLHDTFPTTMVAQQF